MTILLIIKDGFLDSNTIGSASERAETHLLVNFNIAYFFFLILIFFSAAT